MKNFHSRSAYVIVISKFARKSINQTFLSGSVPLKTGGNRIILYCRRTRSTRTLDLQASSIDFERQHDRDRADRRPSKKDERERDGFGTSDIGDVVGRVGYQGG